MNIINISMGAVMVISSLYTIITSVLDKHKKLKISKVAGWLFVLIIGVLMLVSGIFMIAIS